MRMRSAKSAARGGDKNNTLKLEGGATDFATKEFQLSLTYIKHPKLYSMIDVHMVVVKITSTQSAYAYITKQTRTVEILLLHLSAYVYGGSRWLADWDMKDKLVRR